MPLLSIITVTYNAERFLERTIQSLLANQPGDEVEYLIIDGNSKDRTLDIVRNYETHVSHWISEPDRGLYDAMNKGQQLATGDFVWFLNAGDEMHDASTLFNLLNQLRNNPADVYYSDALFVDDTGKPLGLRSKITPHTLPHNLNWRDMAMGMKVCHQAFIARRTLSPPFLVDNLSADVDWEIRCLKTASKIVWLDFVLCKYLVGGLSVQQHRKSLTDRFKVLADHFGTATAVWNHVKIVARAVRFRFFG
ncbi:glycosyltransferase family 2 protein [Larkinella rosea]|uniref:Glycosyltransferase n=1 Tax=Larkinella rosea TaxID=2025312 RepID=A0A3P1BLU2_9BACT|nr:glycosyltransferase family 2 protein [Larkinella rosea]RRB02007.1 glycosyltransferase [Larkinella rosea]